MSIDPRCIATSRCRPPVMLQLRSRSSLALHSTFSGSLTKCGLCVPIVHTSALPQCSPHRLCSPYCPLRQLSTIYSPCLSDSFGDWQITQFVHSRFCFRAHLHSIYYEHWSRLASISYPFLQFCLSVVRVIVANCPWRVARVGFGCRLGFASGRQTPVIPS